jgi:hypothetical protein
VVFEKNLGNLSGSGCIAGAGEVEKIPGGWGAVGSDEPKLDKYYRM